MLEILSMKFNQENKNYNMKSKNIIVIVLFIFAVLSMMQSCTEESTPYSTYGAWTIPVLVGPANGTFISPAGTTVDLQWSSTNADNDSQDWDVYFGTKDEPALYQEGYTSESISVDVNVGTKYYWQVVGHDKNGIPTRSEVWSFEVVDPDAPLRLKLDWSTNIEDAIGIDVSPEDAVDLRLKIVDKSDGSTYALVSASGFKEYTFPNDAPDGTYQIVTDLASTVNAGDFNKSLDISVNLYFTKRGTLSQKNQYPNVMTNDFPCPSYYTILAEVTKSGTSYTIEDVGKAQWTADLPSLAGDWSGEDNMGYDDVVTLSYSGGELKIYGLAFGWIQDWWGEPIQSGNPVPLVFDWSTLGGINIEDQYYITTMWAGDLYDYNIVGTAKLALCGSTPKLTIEYDIAYSEDGWSIGAYLGELFTVTLTPVTTKGAKGIADLSSKPARPLPVKPVR